MYFACFKISFIRYCFLALQKKIWCLIKKLENVNGQIHTIQTFFSTYQFLFVDLANFNGKLANKFTFHS